MQKGSYMHDSVQLGFSRIHLLIYVMLIEIESGTIQETAAQIRDALPRIED
jgi:hypothetical protein